MVVQGSTECLVEFGCDVTISSPAEPNVLLPKATLMCRPNSHPFQDRTLILDQPLKVGRSVARARPVQNNAIFDCKVLSRNHALLWYENGKFFLQDTKSSNGTFVNNQRLSKGSEESPPREVCSGDILQFGVDVMENSRKVTHGCIIATLRLYLPDGKEAKASPTIVNSAIGSSIPIQDLYQLNQCIQESLARERLLENKLLSLSRLVGETEGASISGWKALMDEDRLLTRIEILESQLTAYGKNMTEDKLKEETRSLMEEKESYQKTAKDALKRLVDEKLEALKREKEVEKTLHHMEDEYTSLRQLYDKGMEENRNLSEKMTLINAQLQEFQKKQRFSEDFDVSCDGDTENNRRKDCIYIEDTDVAIRNSISGSFSNNEKLRINLKEKYENEQNTIDMEGSTDSLDGTKPDKSANVNEKLQDIDKIMEELQNMKILVDKLQSLKIKTDNEILNLKLNLEEAINENSVVLEEQVEDGKSTSLISSRDVGELEISLSEATKKIAVLLKLKEKLIKVEADNTQLEDHVKELEEELSMFSMWSSKVTACTLIPILIILVSIIISFFPTVSTLFGTNDF